MCIGLPWIRLRRKRIVRRVGLPLPELLFAGPPAANAWRTDDTETVGGVIGRWAVGQLRRAVGSPVAFQGTDADSEPGANSWVDSEATDLLPPVDSPFDSILGFLRSSF